MEKTKKTITAISGGFDSGNKAEIWLDDKLIGIQPGFADDRGMHVVAFDPKDGHIKFSRTYDTYGGVEHDSEKVTFFADELDYTLSEFSPGTIVAIALKDATMGLNRYT